MAKCLHCEAETELYNCGVPVCSKCSDERESERDTPPAAEQQIRVALVNSIREATARVAVANEEFNAVLDQMPSGLPLPDGAQRIYDASRQLSAARKEMMKAHTRLNEFLSRGIVPDDLKSRSG